VFVSKEGDLPMTKSDRITLYYSPQTRATGTRVLLEELGLPTISTF
jgi:hypothetical protein